MLSERNRLNVSKIPSNRLKMVFIWKEEQSRREVKEEKRANDREEMRKEEGNGGEKRKEGGLKTEEMGWKEGKGGGRRKELIELLGVDLARFFGVGEIGKEGDEGTSLGVWTAKVVWREEKLNYVGKLIVKQKMIK